MAGKRECGITWGIPAKGTTEHRERPEIYWEELLPERAVGVFIRMNWQYTNSY